MKQEIIEAYRKINPRSRAVDYFTYYGSGAVVRRATCIFCREIISTCCNQYPETKTFKREIDEHCRLCALKWYFGTYPYKLKNLLNEANKEEMKYKTH